VISSDNQATQDPGPGRGRLVSEVVLFWSVCLVTLLASRLIALAGGIWAENAGVLPAAFCLLFPVVYGWRLGVPSSDWGLWWGRAPGRTLLVTLIAAVIVFPLYTAGYEGWSILVSGRHFTGIRNAVPSPWWLINLVFVQVVAVALPEEVFYRGWMQSRLGLVFLRRVRILGTPIGMNVVVTAVLFALSHLVLVPSPFRLAVFFPGLLFGYLRERTGSVAASVLLHAASNVLLALLVQCH